VELFPSGKTKNAPGHLTIFQSYNKHFYSFYPLSKCQKNLKNMVRLKESKQGFEKVESRKLEKHLFRENQ
jgi:glutaredoxin-related protein